VRRASDSALAYVERAARFNPLLLKDLDAAQRTRLLMSELVESGTRAATHSTPPNACSSVQGAVYGLLSGG